MLKINISSIINKEEWRPIKIYGHLYQVSNLGNIRNVRKKLLRTWINNNGYECIKFTIAGKGIHKLVHRLVAEVFLIPTIVVNAEINHKDGNKQNNVVTNLEWVTSSANKYHAFNLGLRTKESCISTLGTKHKSNTSKYHNVSYDSNRSKWVASVRHDGKNYMQKRFNTENEAAYHVNYILDTLDLRDRPRNIIY